MPRENNFTLPESTTSIADALDYPVVIPSSQPQMEITSPAPNSSLAVSGFTRGVWQSMALLALMPLMAGIGVASVQAYLGTGFRPLPILMVSSLSLFIYALNRITDWEEDGHNVGGDLCALQRNGIPLSAISSVMVFATALALLARGRFNWVYLVILLAGILYSCKLLPWYSRDLGLRLVRIKEMTFLKNPVIAVVWAISVFVVPFYDAGAGRSQATPAFILLALGFTLCSFLNSFFCDLRDGDGDRAAGVVTLANRLGTRGSHALVFALSLAWAGVVISIAGLTPWLDFSHTFILVALGLGYPGLILLLRKGFPQGSWTVNLAIEMGDFLYALGLVTLAMLAL